jgi:hypothetical protein
MRKPSSFTGIEQCLETCANSYRRNLWATAPVYVEIWCEKDALAGVIMEETKVYDVPLMVARGYSSISFLHEAAKAIEAKDKPAYIYHFGDLDPSGVDAARDIEAKLRRYAPGAEIHFERPAVTREQVEDWNLPTRPTKMTDTRAKKFGSATSVELDAIPANKLRALVRGCIERHVDQQHNPEDCRGERARLPQVGSRDSTLGGSHDRANPRQQSGVGVRRHHVSRPRALQAACRI